LGRRVAGWGKEDLFLLNACFVDTIHTLRRRGTMMNHMIQFMQDQQGATALEYGDRKSVV
jgi:hypothetical protein